LVSEANEVNWTVWNKQQRREVKDITVSGLNYDICIAGTAKYQLYIICIVAGDIDLQ
jgi:hypothetical protein